MDTEQGENKGKVRHFVRTETLHTPKETWRIGIIAIVVNVALTLIKLFVGWIGNSYALIADGIESASDIFTSTITWIGFRLSLRPPDREHPFGHGKLESLAGLFSGVSLLAAAGFIAWQSILEIQTPHHAPSWYTLPVLLGVVTVKEWLSRRVLAAGDDLESQALKGDAWHHRCDAITSGAAAIGITIALIGGEGYESADDWAALAACLIIAANAIRITRGALHDVLDGKVSEKLLHQIVEVAEHVPGVRKIEKCRARKSGIGVFVELHVCVDPLMSVINGHEVGHEVKDTLMERESLRILDVVVHLEPDISLIAAPADSGTAH